MLHHTKNKADVGVAQVIADIVGKGYVQCVPLSEHQPYDLVVVNENGRSFKLQVKYASLMKNGCVEIKSKTVWADRNGNHFRKYKRSSFDYYAIYCPDRHVVLYIPNTEGCPSFGSFENTKNNQDKKVRWAKEYLNFDL